MNSIFKKTKSAKLIAGFVSLTTGVLMLGGAAFTASAQTSSADLTAQINQMLATIAALQGQLSGLEGGSAPVATGTGYTFTSNLSKGDKGEDVKQLQMALNADGTQVASTGVGSTGNETTFFGSLTKSAVIRFQNKYASEILAPVGLSAGTGFVGPSTRTKLNSMGGSVVVPPVVFIPGTQSGVVGCTSLVGFSPTTGQACSAGTTPGNGGAVVVPTGTDMSVTLAATSPRSSAVIAGQAQADLAHFTFTNNSGTEAVITKLTFDRIGIANDATLSNVYLFNGASRVTDAATVSTGVITFNNAGGVFKVSPGNSVTISVQSDVAASTAGQIIGVALASVESNVSVVGSLPIAGNVQTVAASTMGTVVFTYTGPSGTSDNPTSGTRVFEASTVVSTHKARLESVTFENRGTTKDGDLINLQLYVDGVQVGDSIPSFVADRATFDLRNNPVVLDTGTRIIKVLADIVGGSSFTYDIQIRKSSDLRMIDNELNQPILATTFAVSAGLANTLNGGSLSITKAAASPSTNVSVGATNVLWSTYEFRASGEDVKIESVYLWVDQSQALGMDNAKVFVNGSQVGSTKDLGATADPDTTGTEFTFGSSFIAKAGELVTVEVYGDAKTNTAVDYTAATTVDVGISVLTADTEGMNSGNTVTAVIEVEGNSRTMAASSVTSTKASGYGNQTMIAGTNNAKLGSFTLSAGSTEGININTIVVNLSSNESATITDLMLKDNSNGGQIGSTKTAPGTANSFSVNFNIPLSGTRTIDVYGNIKSGSNVGPWIATIDSTTGGTGDQTATTATVGSDLDLQTITVGTGTLTVAVNNGGTPNSFNTVAGLSGGVKVGTFRFTAQNSSFTVKDMKIKIPADAATSVSAVTLKWTGGSSTQALSLSTGAQTHATSTFAGLSIPVPQNDNADVEVWVTTPTIASGASTGKAISVLIDFDEGFKATDGGGTDDTTAAAADLNSAATSGKGTAYVRESVPTLSSSQITTVLAEGSNQVIGKVKISADAAGDIGWKKLSFTINKTSAITLGATTTIALWDVTGGSNNEVAGTFGTTTGSLLGGLDSLVNITSGNITFVATSEEEIQAGSSRDYELRTTIGGTASGSNSVSVSIANPSTSVSTGTATGVAADTVASTPSFGWTDRSSISTVHSESTSDWTDDYLIKTLPLTIGTRSLSI